MLRFIAFLGRFTHEVHVIMSEMIDRASIISVLHHGIAAFRRGKMALNSTICLTTHLQEQSLMKETLGLLGFISTMHFIMCVNFRINNGLYTVYSFYVLSYHVMQSFLYIEHQG